MVRKATVDHDQLVDGGSRLGTHVSDPKLSRVKVNEAKGDQHVEFRVLTTVFHWHISCEDRKILPLAPKGNVPLLAILTS
jgi:hypothetical protein